MLPGWCCIANRHIGARERRQLIPPHVRFQVPFLGPESQLKSGFACAGLLCTLPCADLPHTILALKAGGEGVMRGLAAPNVVIKCNDTVLLLPASVSTAKTD